MGMHTISKEIQFDAGHRVATHGGKCRNPHGHRYRVVAYFTGEVIQDPDDPEYGMLADFSVLKEMLMTEVHDVFDHGFIVHEQDVALLSALSWHHLWKVISFPYTPTAENIARWIYETLRADPRIDSEDSSFKLHAVEVYETPTSMARYE